MKRKRVQFFLQVALLFSLPLLLAMAGCAKKQTTHTENHPMICLFTDYGLQDAYVAQMKGAIKTIAPQAEIIDLTHQAPKFDPVAASYLLDKSVRTFPKETIFVVVIDPGVGTERKAIAVRTHMGKTYIAPDNGILTRVVVREGLREAREITNQNLYFSRPPSSTFHGRDIFGPVAAHLALGVQLSELGPRLDSLALKETAAPTILEGRINAHIIHIDHYGNIITNVQKEDLAVLKPGQIIRITIGTQNHSLPYVLTYGEAPENRPVALPGSDGELEIAWPSQNAAQNLKAAVGTPIVIRY